MRCATVGPDSSAGRTRSKEHVAVLELSDTRRPVSPHMAILEHLLEGSSSQQLAIRYRLLVQLARASYRA
jgi:hypothetical protein